MHCCCTRAYKLSRVFFLCLHILMVHLWICMSDNWLQESAVKDSLFVFERELIRCADVFLILFGAYSVNTICAFHFSRLLFCSTPSASPLPSPPSTLARLLLFPPPPPFPLVLHPLVLAQWKSSAFCCKGWYFWSQRNTYIYVSSTHDCEGHVYNAIGLCQTCQLFAVIHLKSYLMCQGRV